MVMMIIATLADDSDKVFMLNLYKDYYGLVRKIVYNITHDAENIEDLVNDTFLKLLAKISLLRTFESCKTAAYVVYTSRSVAINFIKHRDVANKHVYYGGEKDLREALVVLEETIEERIIHQDEIKEMGNIILRLPQKQKELLYFKYFLEMDNAQLAEVLGIAQASVREYLTRARRNAKKLMDKEMANNHGLQQPPANP
ncbi:RNA polymerase sigma factor [Desulfosporosinus nitroreducens]|uniref:Sigma-70 family RNA polymerase sigma factor n=1 Tax=Desulfosporosinus nitroreducens TaxID=2018668 RepID=A0ABT8QTB3_9FIRM|nr:sigma-70 family RNA polymerase sigma factor [Desulfosporosinus nitroreducens]MDO0823875.1 sigma-70 family RNA polymerase sigma factor [Desulfosporosinus nitroreducens]